MRIRLANKRAGPTFVYLFAHKGQASFSEIFKGDPETFYGVCHAEELMYLFPIAKDLFQSAAPTAEDTFIRKTLVAIWVSFATNG